MLTKCGNPLIWDAHLLKEVMKSNHFLVESIESQTNHFWSPPSSFLSFGVHMASDCQKNLPWTLGEGLGNWKEERGPTQYPWGILIYQQNFHHPYYDPCMPPTTTQNQTRTIFLKKA
jgi:hypothetical protein